MRKTFNEQSESQFRGCPNCPPCNSEADLRTPVELGGHTVSDKRRAWKHITVEHTPGTESASSLICPLGLPWRNRLLRHKGTAVPMPCLALVFKDLCHFNLKYFRNEDTICKKVVVISHLGLADRANMIPLSAACNLHLCNAVISTTSLLLRVWLYLALFIHSTPTVSTNEAKNKMQF